MALDWAVLLILAAGALGYTVGDMHGYRRSLHPWDGIERRKVPR